MAEQNYAAAIEAELKRVGITQYEFHHGGKHPRVVYYQGGVKKMYVFAKSPSDGVHGLQNCLGALRRQMGVAAPKVEKSTRAEKRRIARETAPMPDSFTVKPDPLLVLKAWKPRSRFEWTRTSGNTWRVETLTP